MKSLTLSLVVAMLFTGVALAQGEYIATLRGEVALDGDSAPPRMNQVEDSSVKRARNYPMQPPTIPHKIDNYQVDISTNKCMSCHSRRRTEESQAPMVSVTHYMDRDGNFLAEVSPRRYFCSQCHVVQTDASGRVENTFQDVDTIISERASSASN